MPIRAMSRGICPRSSAILRRHLEPWTGVMTSKAERQELLRLARESLRAHVRGQQPVPPHVTGELARRSGAFVTLHSRGKLRGCIGHVEPDEPLADVVSHCAVAACSADPRFPAVTLSELPHVDIELSVLGPLEPVATLEEIDVGRHGLV